MTDQELKDRILRGADFDVTVRGTVTHYWYHRGSSTESPSEVTASGDIEHKFELLSLARTESAQLMRVVVSGLELGDFRDVEIDLKAAYGEGSHGYEDGLSVEEAVVDSLWEADIEDLDIKWVIGNELLQKDLEEEFKVSVCVIDHEAKTLEILTDDIPFVSELQDTEEIDDDLKLKAEQVLLTALAQRAEKAGLGEHAQSKLV